MPGEDTADTVSYNIIEKLLNNYDTELLTLTLETQGNRDNVAFQ